MWRAARGRSLLFLKGVTMKVYINIMPSATASGIHRIAASPDVEIIPVELDLHYLAKYYLLASYGCIFTGKLMGNGRNGMAYMYGGVRLRGQDGVAYYEHAYYAEKTVANVRTRAEEGIVIGIPTANLTESQAVLYQQSLKALLKKIPVRNWVDWAMAQFRQERLWARMRRGNTESRSEPATARKARSNSGRRSGRRQEPNASRSTWSGWHIFYVPPSSFCPSGSCAYRYRIHGILSENFVVHYCDGASVNRMGSLRRQLMTRSGINRTAIQRAITEGMAGIEDNRDGNNPAASRDVAPEADQIDTRRIGNTVFAHREMTISPNEIVDIQEENGFQVIVLQSGERICPTACRFEMMADGSIQRVDVQVPEPNMRDMLPL